MMVSVFHQHLFWLNLQFIDSSQTIYDNPDEFDGFRFAKLREADEHDGVTKYQMVNTAPDYVTFGHGKHAW
jgi:cytochrome P450